MLSHKDTGILNSIVLALFVALLLLGGTILADDYRLALKGDPEVDILMETLDYANAEKLARRKNLDPRIISTVMAFAGKKDEAITSFIDYLTRVPENIREDFAMQTVHLASEASPSIGEDLLHEITNRGIVSAESVRVKCRWIQSDMMAGNLDSAEKKLRALLVSAQPIPNDVKFVANTLVARLNMGGEKEKASEITQLLHKKFPDDLDVIVQRISSQIADEPRAALIELDKLKQSNLEFYSSNESFLEYLKAESLVKLGETERAKVIYEKLLQSDSDVEDAIMASLNPILREEARKNAEKERWEKELSEPKHDISPRSPHRFWLILAINIIFIAMIVHKIYRQKWRRQ